MSKHKKPTKTLTELQAEFFEVYKNLEKWRGCYINDEIKKPIEMAESAIETLKDD